MYDWLLSVGVTIKNAVLLLASTLKSEAASGLVTLLLIAALFVAVLMYLVRNYSQRSAVAWLRKLVVESADRTSFAEGISALDHKVETESTSRGRKHLASAWSEYRETLVAYEQDGVIIFRNAVRPSIFFNPEDLRFGAGSWRTIPGLFVSIGLFLTFLGLISALSSMDLTVDKVQDSLRDLLRIASAKFIMSLTGLFCSILFTIVLRRGMATLEHSIYELCGIIEKRLTYISLEDLAVEQLSAIREQREHFRMIGLELVAELGRPLREDLPVAISNSISSARRS